MEAADRLFGEIAVELGHLSRDGLAACIRTHYDSPPGTTLSAIALNLGLMKQAEIDLVLLQQARIGDRPKAKPRAGVVEIDATLGGSAEERGGRPGPSVHPNSMRATAREATTQTRQASAAVPDRTPSSSRQPTANLRAQAPAAQAPTIRAESTTAAAQAAATAARRPDRTLVGAGAPAIKKAESTPSHEAITIAPPPPIGVAADDDSSFSGSDDPEVSFETETPAPGPAVASPATAAAPGVDFRRRSTPPHVSPTASDDGEINFGSLLSVPPKPTAPAARAPLGGTLHGVGAAKPATAPQPSAAAKPQPSAAAKQPIAESVPKTPVFAAKLPTAPAKPPAEPQLPSMPPMVGSAKPAGTPPHGVAGARPRSGTLEFKPSVTPEPAKIDSKPPRKPSGTIQHFRAVAPAPGDDSHARPTVGPSPVSRGWGVDQEQPLVVPSMAAPQVRRPSARPPRRASAWFSSRPAVAGSATSHGSGIGGRVDHASADLSDAALAQIPQGNEPLMFRALRAALDRGSHDLHLHCAAPIMMRQHGNMQPLFGGAPLGPRAVEKALAQIMSDEQWRRLGEVGEVMFSVELPDTGRARVSAYRSEAGCDAVVRVMPSEPRSLTDIGLPASLAKLLDYESGLIVCTGPVGSGVTTTIGALLASVVTTRQVHVVTVEETIELRMPATRALISQRQLGVHVDDMAHAVRAIAHEDADLIAIGDLRHPADVALALSLAHGGHLVVAGAHARGAADCLNRLLRPFGRNDQGQARTMVAQSLRAVISQELVVRADGKGRVPAVELIVPTTAVSDMIRRGAPLDTGTLTASGKAQKLVTLADSLQRLVAAGTVTRAEAERVTQNRMRQA